ncbi:EAL domain-containing protein [Porticoccus sp. W117]|uniref:EAL domain-containing protein n=1 Tax=Porticoccus sp. W117 TaxID=3054777 RepID=UPI002593C117|nr:EAL domain-containing protein [Porticoccus sp. W117]MDM3870111.1 EAL domain-containing protein [Porticoccus sp. W117]
MLSQAKWIIISLILACSHSAATTLDLSQEEIQFIKANPEIVVGGEMDWPPMDFVADGIYQGAAKDYLDEIETISGLKFKVVTGYTWSELMQLLDNREIDMVPMMYWSNRRGQIYNMTNPYITVRHYVFTKGERPDIVDLMSLEGKTVAIPKGYASIEHLADSHPGIKIRQVPTVLDAIDAVVVGKADAIIENTASVGWYSLQHNILGLKPAFPINFDVNNVHMAVRRDWPVLRSILEKSLRSIPKETTAAIMEKWTGSETAARTFLTSEARFSPQEIAYIQDRQGFSACVLSSYLPFESTDVHGHQGMSLDYLTITSDSLGRPFSIVPVSQWDQAAANIKAGNCDLATFFADTGNSKEGITSTVPLYSDDLVLVTRLDSPFVSSLGELPDATIAVIKGYSNLNDLQQSYPNIRFKQIDSRADAYQLIESNQVFGVLDFILAASHEISRRYQTSLKIGSVPTENPINISFAIRSDEPELVSAVNKIFNSIPNSQHKTIRDKWVALKVEERVDYRLAIQVLVVALIVLAVVVAFLINMRRHRTAIQSKNAELQTINLELKEQRQVALHRANHDQLTGLSNRHKLIAELEYAKKCCDRSGEELALLFVDLDRFKAVNDTLGHEFGDQLLVAVADRLKSLFRETDHLARIGGDEFVAVLPRTSDKRSASIVSQRVIKALTKPFDVQGHSLTIGASIGIAFYPSDAQDMKMLMRYADGAMYAAKNSDSDSVHFHNEDFALKMQRRLAIEKGLNSAFENNSFELVFQPIVSLETGKAVKAEALLRWNDPDLGAVSPIEFIPIAEELGIIKQITDWVLDQVCATLVKLAKRGCHLEAIAINVSSVEFGSGTIADRFQQTLQKHSIDAQQIEVEITEGHMLDRGHKIDADLQSLRDIGHNISVDDFGTGYSSLSYMKRLPIHLIKIDREFVRDIPDIQSDVEITQAIISLSHALGYKVVAEGVETEDQLTFLKSHGCDLAQGYYFAKPLPVDGLFDAIKRIGVDACTAH